MLFRSLAERLMDVPRNIRAHSSGVVISSRPLAETVPVMWSASPGGMDESEITDFKSQRKENRKNAKRQIEDPAEWESKIGTKNNKDNGYRIMDTDDADVSIIPYQLSGNHLRIIQWDKRSAKYFFDKFDILCLRGQDVLSGVQKRINITTARTESEIGRAHV